MKLTWRREKRQTGLAAIGQGPRGYNLHINSVHIGSANDLPTGWQTHKGFYWSARESKEYGIEHRNTARTITYDTMEEAKAALKDYVVECLKAKGWK